MEKTSKKTCSKCEKLKSLNEFFRNKNTKDGHESACKECRNKRGKAYREANREKERKRKKTYYEANREQENKRKKEWYKNLEPVTGVDLNQTKACTQCGEIKKLYDFHVDISNRTHGRKSACADCRNERKSEWSKNNPEYQKEYNRKRRKEDSDFRFRCILRNATNRIFKGLSKDSATKEIIGCSFDEAKVYLISNAPDGFTWEQLGLNWHVDHIIPLAKHDLTNEKERQAAGHISNLQILPGAENQSKSDSLPPGFEYDDYMNYFESNYISTADSDSFDFLPYVSTLNIED